MLEPRAKFSSLVFVFTLAGAAWLSEVKGLKGFVEMVKVFAGGTSSFGYAACEFSLELLVSLPLCNIWRAVYNCSILYALQTSPVATGGVSGLISPNKAPSPPKLIYETLNQWNFCQIWMSSPPLHRRKTPCWRLSVDGFASNQGCGVEAKYPTPTSTFPKFPTQHKWKFGC